MTISTTITVPIVHDVLDIGESVGHGRMGGGGIDYAENPFLCMRPWSLVKSAMKQDLSSPRGMGTLQLVDIMQHSLPNSYEIDFLSPIII